MTKAADAKSWALTKLNDGSYRSIQPPFPNYRLIFNDDFTSFSANDSGSAAYRSCYPWGARTNNPGAEDECYVDESVLPGSGGSNYTPFSNPSSTHLRIEATKASVTGANALGLNYNSGLICTDQAFWCQYGYFEIAARMPAGPGLWPAFWLLPTTLIYNAEIDVVEELGGDTSTAYTTLHSGTNGATSDGPYGISISDFSAGEHVYAVDWDPTHITVYYDRVQKHQFTTPSTIKQTMYWLANLAVGTSSSWPGAPDGTTVFPAYFDIDYVRVYANANTTGIGGTKAIP